MDELLEASVKAVKEAPNRSVKRRLRQRLHKKLGAMLSQEEYEAALSRLRSMESSSSGSEGWSEPSEPARPRAERRNSEPVSNQGLDHWKPSMAMNPVRHAQSILQQVAGSSPENTPVPEIDMPGGFMAAPPGDWAAAPLPVQRTFIHCDEVNPDSNIPSRTRSPEHVQTSALPSRWKPLGAMGGLRRPTAPLLRYSGAGIRNDPAPGKLGRTSNIWRKRMVLWDLSDLSFFCQKEILWSIRPSPKDQKASSGIAGSRCQDGIDGPQREGCRERLCPTYLGERSWKEAYRGIPIFATHILCYSSFGGIIPMRMHTDYKVHDGNAKKIASH